MVEQKAKPSESGSVATLERDDVIVIAGWGRCKSCGCTGFVKKNGDICECKHHFRQHE